MKRARLLRIDGKGTGKIGFVGDVVAKQKKREEYGSGESPNR
jgi:hypothetical protein